MMKPQSKPAHDKLTDEIRTRITELTGSLDSKDGLVREKARISLVKIGKPAVPELIRLLKAHHEQVRWEASKALATIADPSSAAALIKTLEDDAEDVRWIAAEGLIALGPSVLPPLLKALMTHPKSAWLREGAHHILHEQTQPSIRKKLTPLLKTLDDFIEEDEIGIAAQKTLDDLQ